MSAPTAPGRLTTAQQIPVWLRARRTWIKNGQLADVVRNPNYRGVTVDFWNRLGAVGKKTKLRSARRLRQGEPSG